MIIVGGRIGAALRPAPSLGRASDDGAHLLGAAGAAASNTTCVHALREERVCAER
jgi:hypothetical protein